MDRPSFLWQDLHHHQESLVMSVTGGVQRSRSSSKGGGEILLAGSGGCQLRLLEIHDRVMQWLTLY